MYPKPDPKKITIDSIKEEYRITDALFLIGVRSFFTPKNNKRGVYDDAIFVYSNNTIIGFNANTDPSKFGINKKIGKGMANLKLGLWNYKQGYHKGKYPAFVQDKEVTVIRDGGVEETGFFGINIHKGGDFGTSSEGCQTLVPNQWKPFQEYVYNEMKKNNTTKIKYLLISF